MFVVILMKPYPALLFKLFVPYLAPMHTNRREIIGWSSRLSATGDWERYKFFIMWQSRFFWKQRSLIWGTIAGFVTVILIHHASLTTAQPAPKNLTPAAIEQTLVKLPPPLPHPLPAALAQQPTNQAGDYFDQIQSSPVGALIWSSFPITVYIQPVTPNEQGTPFLAKRTQTWITAIRAAVQEWNAFLPMMIIDQPQVADITIQRSVLSLRLEPGKNEAGDRRFTLPRARSAETRYELYTKPTGKNSAHLLAHRMSIYIRPDQASEYLQAAARHELGHALGIWGHSPNQADALYFSQVRTPAKISLRDINTLKRIYQQPTRLGWEMPSKF